MSDDMGAFCKARDFAQAAHGDQQYAGKPYVLTHVAAVVRVLHDFGYHDLTDAGWLHDVLEDTNTSHECLIHKFGLTTANIVWAVTGVGENRKARNECIYNRIARVPRAAIVKVADRIANVEAAESGSNHKAMYRKESDAFYRRVASMVPDVMVARLEVAYK